MTGQVPEGWPSTIVLINFIDWMLFLSAFSNKKVVVRVPKV